MRIIFQAAIIFILIILEKSFGGIWVKGLNLGKKEAKLIKISIFLNLLKIIGLNFSNDFV